MTVMTPPGTVPCPRCNGTGKVYQDQRQGKTARKVKRTCPRCSGNGYVSGKRK